MQNYQNLTLFLGLQPAQTQVLFYYLGYGSSDNLPYTQALAETFNMKEQDTAFTG